MLAQSLNSYLKLLKAYHRSEKSGETDKSKVEEMSSKDKIQSIIANTTKNKVSEVDAFKPESESKVNATLTSDTQSNIHNISEHNHESFENKVANHTGNSSASSSANAIVPKSSSTKLQLQKLDKVNIFPNEFNIKREDNLTKANSTSNSEVISHQDSKNSIQNNSISKVEVQNHERKNEDVTKHKSEYKASPVENELDPSYNNEVEKRPTKKENFHPANKSSKSSLNKALSTSKVSKTTAINSDQYVKLLERESDEKISYEKIITIGFSLMIVGCIMMMMIGLLFVMYINSNKQ